MILLEDRSYVRVEGFEIRNNLGVRDGSGIRILGAGDGIEIRDLVIHEMRGQNAMGITVYGTSPTPISGLIIDGNFIHDCEPAPSEALTLNGNVTTFEVTNNRVFDVNNIGIDFIGGETDIQPDPTKVARNGLCRGNEVRRARSVYGGGFAGGIYVDGGRNILIERNLVTESDLGLEVGAENPGTLTRDIVVRNNRIFRNDKAGIVFGGFDASVGRVSFCDFLNNTVYQNDTLGEGFGDLWIQWAEANVVRNNLFSGLRSVVLFSGVGNLANDLDYNLWRTEAGTPTFVWQGLDFQGLPALRSGTGQELHGVTVDPQFVGAGAEDFHLRAESPARDAGDPGFLPALGELDIDGAPRLVGSRVDLGADEITCGNGTLDAGESCDDANLVDCDGCDSNCTASSSCGNSIRCGAEQCDDGNTSSGDCCSSLCSFEGMGTGCSDGDLCTHSDACDGAGECVGIAGPAPACKFPTSAGKSSFQLSNSSVDLRDTFTWKWTRGEETLLTEFGDPASGPVRYGLCLYDQSASSQPLAKLEILPGGTCSARDCWRELGRGFKYRSRTGNGDGVRSVDLFAGDAGKARAGVVAKGARLTIPTLPLSPPVMVQLHNDFGACWGAVYSIPVKNDDSRFKAKSD
jgi:cysteine-rich repeat protein